MHKERYEVVVSAIRDVDLLKAIAVESDAATPCSGVYILPGACSGAHVEESAVPTRVLALFWAGCELDNCRDNSGDTCTPRSNLGSNGCAELYAST